MKAYVIKNEEGKYWQWLFNNEPDWEEKLYNGFMHYSQKDAEKSIEQWQLKDCEVVEITIAEGDLEKENEVLRRALELACEDMVSYSGIDYDVLYYVEQAKQLKEKDKEVSQLKREISTLPSHDKELRHQVCQEIRECLNNCGNFVGWYLTKKKLNKILDKFEGEE